MRSHDQTSGTKNVFYFLLFHRRTLYDQILYPNFIMAELRDIMQIVST